MRRTLILLGLLPATLLGCARRPTELGDFKKFTSVDGRFTAEFPGDPKEVNQPTPTEIGTIVGHTFSVQLGSSEYLASYSDLPDSLSEAQRKRFSVKRAVDAEGAEFASAMHSRVVNERNISLGKWSGREWDLQSVGPANEDFRWRAYYVGTRQYQIGVGWRHGEKPSEEMVNKFLNSLTILAE